MEHVVRHDRQAEDGQAVRDEEAVRDERGAEDGLEDEYEEAEDGHEDEQDKHARDGLPHAPSPSLELESSPWPSSIACRVGR